MPERTLVRVGFLRDYMPYSFVDADQVLQGFDVDVAGRVSQVLGLRLELVVDSLPGLMRRLAQGELAWLGNQLLATPERRRQVDLVKPAYASIQLCVIQHENDQRDFLSLEDLHGHRLGVLADTGIEAQARGVLGRSVRSYGQIEQALRDLSEHKLDAVLEENLIVDHYIDKQHLPLRVAAPFAAPMTVGLAVRKGDAARQIELSAAVTQILRDGSLGQIARRWFGYDVSRSRVSHS